jgi:hypothetical protein
MLVITESYEVLRRLGLKRNGCQPRSRLIAFGLDLRSVSARWDSPWLARAEEIPQEKRIVSLTNPVVENPGGWAAGIRRTAPADDRRLLLR